MEKRTRDMMILSELRKNSRIKLTELSEQLGVPISTVFEKVRYFNSKMNVRYISLLDFSRLGYPFRVTLIIKANKSRKDELREYLSNHRNLNNLIKINNGFDYLAEFIYRSIYEFEEMVQALEQEFRTQKIDSYYEIEPIKKEVFVPENAPDSLLDIS
jgi:DNA-binding Lrp family transcriptional regulator